MQNKVLRLENLNPEAVHYIRELESGYEQRIKTLQNNYETSIKEMKNEYLILKEKYDLLIYKRFVRSAEQLIADGNQPLLLTCEGTHSGTGKTASDDTFEAVRSFKRKKKGRKAIDPKIPREETVIDLEETEKICACGAKLTKIGEESNEKLHIEPPRIYVKKIVRPKYACRCCEGTESEGIAKTVRIAPVEPSIIPRSIVSASLLSCIITQKYEDHLPYFRQEKQFERIMVRISRQDMSNWQQQAYVRLKPLFELLQAAVKDGPVLRMDETTAHVMGEEGREDTQNSYIWLARGGPPGKTVVWYEYHETRGAYHAKALLEGYRGYLQTDGYVGYDTAVEGNNDIIHVGCFAHARRKFFGAAKVMEQAATAEAGIRYIKKLYGIEAELRKKYAPDDTDTTAEHRALFLSERKDGAGPVLAEFKEWLIQHKDEVPESVLLGKAIGYSLGQWDKLARYLESPYLTPDNNACENAIRPFVLGRKNWLFNKSPQGAESSCGMYTLIQTAKQNGLIPLRYLTALFEKAPLAASPDDWVSLLPWNIFNS